MFIGIIIVDIGRIVSEGGKEVCVGITTGERKLISADKSGFISSLPVGVFIHSSSSPFSGKLSLESVLIERE